MRPRKDVYALDYIGAMVNSYESLKQEAQHCDESALAEDLQWASDVLSEYFRVVKQHPVIDEARKSFHALPEQLADRATSRTPYKRNLQSPQTVSFESLHELAKHRRSVRWFQQVPVPRDLIDKAIEVAALSPSACNRQPFEFRVYDDPDLVQKVAAAPMGTKGFSHNFPAIVVLTGYLRAFFSERDRHLIYVDASLAAMSFVLALETLGLSSCCINWPDIESRERSLARILSLAADERPVMVIALGYPDSEGLVAYSQKRPVDKLRSYNRTS